MAVKRKRHSAAFKARVALEAAKQTRTIAELAKAYQVHPVQISQWKKQLVDGVETLFRDGRRREREEGQTIQAELYEKIGRLNMEIEWLKKSRVANLPEQDRCPPVFLGETERFPGETGEFHGRNAPLQASLPP